MAAGAAGGRLPLSHVVPELRGLSKIAAAQGAFTISRRVSDRVGERHRVPVRLSVRRVLQQFLDSVGGAIVNVVGIAQVAELMGHASTEMVSSTYGHLADKLGHLRDAARKAISG
jgi:hypothetical protein